LAEQARSEGQHVAAVKLCATADKASHSKARHLSRLMLTGERRFRRDKQHQKQAAAHARQFAATAEAEGNLKAMIAFQNEAHK